METTRVAGQVGAQAWDARIWLTPEAQLTWGAPHHSHICTLAACCVPVGPSVSSLFPSFIPKAMRLLMLQPPRMFSLLFLVHPKPPSLRTQPECLSSV